MKTQPQTGRYFPDVKCHVYGCENVTFYGEYCERCTNEIESLRQMASAVKPKRERGPILEILLWTLVAALAAWGGWALAQWMVRS